jgi:hypothetical protein
MSRGGGVLIDPGPQPPQLGQVIKRDDLLEQRSHAGYRKRGKRRASILSFVLSLIGKRENFKLFAIEAPHLRNTQGGVDFPAVDGAASNIDFDGQVGRWIPAQVDFQLAGDFRRVLDVKATVGLQTPQQVLSAKRCGPAAQEGMIQDIRENFHQPAQDSGISLVAKLRRHDFQSPPIIGEPDSAVANVP